MKKRKLVFIVGLILLTFCSLSLFADWDYVAGGYISKIEFVGNDGWAVLSEGLVIHTPDGGATWEYQHTATTERLYDVSFVDNLEGWVTGNDGLIFHTTDGGNTWTQQNSSTTTNLQSINFVDALNGWAAGSYGTVLHTSDGGVTWSSQTSGITTKIYSIFFVDTLNGWAVAASDYIIHTTDGGATWVTQTNPTTDSMKDVIFYDVNEGWATGLKKIIHTIDGGATWVQQTNPADENLYGIGMGDNNHLWVVGIDGEILATTDGGTTWIEQSFSLDWFLGTYFEDNLTGWIVGSGGAIYKTIDGGSNWIVQQAGTSSGLRRTVFVDDNNVWGCGTKGFIIHSGDGGLTWESKDSGFDDWIWDITFASDNLHGWAAGDDQTGETPILATVDGGETWIQQPTSIYVDIVGISAVSATEVFAAAKSGIILHTTDGGTTWNQQTSGVSIDFKSIEMLSEDIGWAVGSSGTIIYTNDGGTTWTQQTSGTTENIYDVSFVDLLNGWAVAYGGVILHTTDGGTTWSFQPSGTTGNFTRVSAIDLNEVWAVAGEGFHTTDGGLTWTSVPIPCSIGLWGVDFANSNLGVAMGNGGIVARYTSGITFDPPENLFVDSTGFATWDPPLARDLIGYNIYLDGVFVGFSADLFWQYTGLVVCQTYIAGVAAVYDEGQSLIIEYEFHYNPGGDPGIAVDPTIIDETLDPDQIVVVPLTITNTGTAELTYNITIVEYTSDQYRAKNHKPSYGQSYGQTRNLTENKPDDPAFNELDPNATNHSHGVPPTDDLFDWQFEWPVGVGGGEAGIETDGDYIYTTKWNGTTFFRYAIDGTYIEEFSVTGCPGGIRDLAWDGTYFYGAAATNTVYEMDFDAQTVISTINAPIAVRAIAYDEVSDGFWANNWSTTITLFDRNGTTLDSFPCGVFQSYYGFAWENQLADGPYLWGYAQDGASSNQIVQFDIATGLETGVNFDIGSIFTVGTGIAGGMCISDEFVPGTWTICGTSQNTIIWGVELCAGDEPWISVDPISGTVPAGGVDIVDVTLDATGLIGVTKTADIIIANNTGVDVIVPVTMEVTEDVLDPPENLFVTDLGYATWDPPGGGGPGTVQVDPQAVPYWTGTCTNAAFTDDNAVRAWDLEHGWMMFDVSAIPAGATISNIQFNGYVNNTNWPYWAITQVTSDPLTATAGGMYTDIDTGPDYNYYMESSTFPTGWKVDDIGGTADADLEAALAQGWWPIGIRTDDYYITYGLTFDGWNDTNPPFLMVDYESDDGIVSRTRVDLNSKVKHQERLTAPTNRDLLGYNVYLGGAFVEFTTDEFYQYTGLNPGDTYMAGVTALYDEGESSMIEYEFTYEPSLFDPPENVQVDPYNAIVTWEPPGGTIYGDDFESYTVGGYLAVQSDDWTTWTNNPGSAEDAFISDDYASSGTNSVKVDGTTDLVLIMENYTTGAYSIDLNMYIPTGYCGYYNLQKTNVPGTEWGFQIMFDVTGIASIDGGAAAACTFPFDFDTWMNFEIIVDLDNDLCEFFYDGTLMHSYPWTLGCFGTPGLLQLGGVNMYAWASAGNNPLYYFDDVSLSLVNAEPSEELTGYNVWLDDLINPIQFITYTTGLECELLDFVTLIYGDNYEAGVSAVYDDPGESDIIWEPFTFTQEPINPPENLVATLYDYNDVHLEWEPPSGTAGGVLAHHSGYDNNGIGTGAAADWMCAARFDAVELAEYYGSDLTAVNVHIRTADFSYVAVKVWEGGSFGNPGTEVYSADITGSVLIEEWTEHTLTTPIPLISGNEYWIGYDISATGDHPSSVDAGPAVPGKGDWMFYSGIWQEISVAFALDYNWCIEGVVGAGDGILMTSRVAKNKVRTPQLRSMITSGIPEVLTTHPRTKRIENNREDRMLLGYNVYRNSNVIAYLDDPNLLTYDDLALDGDTYEYWVTAVYDNGESDPSNAEEVTVILYVPQNLVAIVQGINNAFLTWDAPSDRDLDYYNIYRNEDQIATNISSTFYLDIGLEAGTYTYNVTAVYDGEWESEFSNDATVTVDVGGIPLPIVTELNGNYPNPFNPETSIKFALNEAGNVRIDVFNLKGQHIRTVINEHLEAAYHSVIWDGKDNNGISVSSGVYFYKMDAAKYTSTKKMILMK